MVMSGTVAINTVVHRRDHRKQSSLLELPLTKEVNVVSGHVLYENRQSPTRRRRTRRKRKRAGLLRFISFHVALLQAAFQWIIVSTSIRFENLRSRRHYRWQVTKRSKVSSFVLWTVSVWLLGIAGRTWYRRRALQLLLDPRSGFHPQWHPTSRRERFPDVDMRVKLYMSNWYLPPCPSADDADERVRFDYHYEGQTLVVHVNVTHNADTFDTYALNSEIRPDLPLILRQDMVDICMLSDRWFNMYRWLERVSGRDWRITDHFVDHQGMRPYCEDAVEILSYSRRILEPEDQQLRRYLEATSDKTDLPVIAQFGDEPTSHLQHIKVPYFKKFRTATTAPELSRVTMPPEEGRIDDPDSQICTSERPRMFSKDGSPVYSPILWVLRKTRHFGSLCEIPALDTPWERKTNKAIWRGTLTGIRAIADDESDYHNCMKMLRCRIAYEYHGSSSVDAGLAYKWPTFPSTINGRSIVAGFRSVSEQLGCKAIIILEGNDVATGLKWALLSRSVVMMPPPTVTSWAMEEILEPWVHYIPLDADGLNAEERVQWIVDNDEKARKIAERATLFIYDLMFHPDADSDDHEVKSEIMRRYHEYFVHS